MFGLIYLLIRLMFMMLVLCAWLVVAAAVLPIMIVTSLTGNYRTARQLQSSLRWRRIL